MDAIEEEIANLKDEDLENKCCESFDLEANKPPTHNQPSTNYRGITGVEEEQGEHKNETNVVRE